MNQFTVKHLLRALENASLPHNINSVLRWEKAGVIARPQGMLNYKNGNWRIYTSAEIAEIVQIVKQRKGVK